jgi:hypothetical protein
MEGQVSEGFCGVFENSRIARGARARLVPRPGELTSCQGAPRDASNAKVLIIEGDIGWPKMSVPSQRETGTNLKEREHLALFLPV